MEGEDVVTRREDIRRLKDLSVGGEFDRCINEVYAASCDMVRYLKARQETNKETPHGI